MSNYSWILQVNKKSGMPDHIRNNYELMRFNHTIHSQYFCSVRLQDREEGIMIINIEAIAKQLSKKFVWSHTE